MENLKSRNNLKNSRGTTYFFRIIFGMSMIGVLFSTCKKNQPLGPQESSKGRAPKLESSADNLELDQGNSTNTAIEFSWSAGSNHGTNSAIDYTLQFDMKGNNFKSPLNVSMGRGTYSKAYTGAEFNTLLSDELNIDPGSTVDVEVRIKSATSDSTIEADFSNTVELAATPYKPVSTTLYLIGSAAPNGWDANNATALDPDPDKPYIFTYEGNLATGDFKFITTLGQFSPSYNRDQDDSHLFHRTEESQPDDKFSLSDPGPYSITVNLVELTISIEKLAGPPYSKLWVVGSATPNGWDLDNAAKMRQNPGDPFLFDYNEVLAAGEFKVATAKDFNAPFYRPTSNHPDLSNTEVQLSAGDPDNKWNITDPGAYKITLNVRDMTISIQKFTSYDELWLVGDATPTGWNIDNPTPMEADPNNEYVFTYDGDLSTGEFKIPVATGDFGTDYFMPGVNHQPLDSTYVRFIPGGSPDNKWQVDAAGSYSIKLNQLYETIEIQKQ